MSQTQFVEYREAGFWAYDVALGVFLKHAIDAAEERPRENHEPWLVDAVAWWRVVATVNSYGLELGDGWSDTEIATFLSIAREACRRIRLRISFPAEEMAAWTILDGQGVVSRGDAEMLSGPINELGEAVIALVQGDLAPAPGGSAWLFGTASGRRTIAMRSP